MRKRLPRRPPGSRKHPTLIDVAELVGVSTSTVSRAISSPDRVSKETRERVQAAIAKVGFVPNVLAVSLASNRTRMIAFVVPAFSLMLFDESIRIITRDLSEAGYQVLIFYGRSTGSEMDKLILDVLSLRPDGLILMGSPLTDAVRARLGRARIPVVEAWGMPADPIDMVAGFSHKQLGRKIGEFLLERGYQRPLLVWSTGARAVTMQDALAYVYVHAGLPAPAVHTCKFPVDFNDGREALRTALASGAKPDVLVCLSDWAAHGGLIEAKRHGLRVPEDIAITGFGDLDFAEQLDPPLTTVRIDQEGLAHATADFLLQRLRGGAPANPVFNVEAKVIARASA